MGRLIDTADLNNQIMLSKGRFGCLAVYISNVFEDIIRDTPTVESDIRIGEWDKDGACPFCGYLQQWEDDTYCGNCGAKLGVKQDDE